VESTTPEALLLRDTLGPELKSAMDALPEVFREAVWLRDVEEFSYAEIAKMVDVVMQNERKALHGHFDFQVGLQKWVTHDCSPRKVSIHYVDMAFNQRRAVARISPILLKSIERVAAGSILLDHVRTAQAVADLSRLFTTDRASLKSDYLDHPAHAAAYLKYFLPVNLSKIQILLDEMPQGWPDQASGRAIRILDVGSGPGAGALAALDWFHQHWPDRIRDLTVVAIDVSAEALNQARQIWDTYSRESGATGGRLIAYEGSLECSSNGPWPKSVDQQAPYDLIIMANCLNELFFRATNPIESRVDIVTQLLAGLTPTGI
jgi:ribosomal protein RSM22 (predicted rRNA methylase)